MRKTGFITRLKLALFFLVRPDRRDMQVMSCEYCNSLNIKKVPNTQNEASLKGMKCWSSKYQCQKCGAICSESQYWRTSVEGGGQR